VAATEVVVGLWFSVVGNMVSSRASHISDGITESHLVIRLDAAFEAELLQVVAVLR
jgi:hypothetical protein